MPLVVVAVLVVIAQLLAHLEAVEQLSLLRHC
jgi:hypothetical protein